MSPEQLAERHRRLYHVTAAGAWASIEARGLLSTSALLGLFEVPENRRLMLTRSRRPSEIRLKHLQHGCAILTDNRPLSERKLASCLDDGLTPPDWLERLNSKVFFWTDPRRVDKLLGAVTNRERVRDVLVFDTLSLVRDHYEKVAISPINSGSTLRKPARRGVATFAPLKDVDWPEWRRQRRNKTLDEIVEVVVEDGVPDIKAYRVEAPWRPENSGVTKRPPIR